MTRIQEAIDRWDRTSEKYVKFGASDTEPRAVFTEILVAMVQGNDPVVPRKAKGPDGWCLFSDMPGVGNAARALAADAREVVRLAKQDPDGLREAVEHRYGYIPY